jgi:monofunctional chorismate mutase
MKSINSLREEIDSIDNKILNLIKKRALISKEIGKLKKLSKTPIKDKNREKEILKKLKNPYEVQIFKKIISESRKLQTF